MIKPKQKLKHYNKINAVFYTIVTLALFVLGFFLDYPENAFAFACAILVCLCSAYWIRKTKQKELKVL